MKLDAICQLPIEYANGNWQPTSRTWLGDGWDGMDGWMTCDFTSFLTVFQSYQDDVWMIMKGCVHG